MSIKVNWDALGITTSVACAIHCAVLPLAISSFPVLGVNIIHNTSFEYGMIVLAFLIGLQALHHGFQKHHRSRLPLLVFSAGILLLLAKQLWHTWEMWFLVPAVIFIVSAHYINYRLLRLAPRNHHHGYRSA